MVCREEKKNIWMSCLGVYQNLGIVYDMLEQKDSALYYYKYALRLETTNPLVKGAILYNLGAFYKSQGERDSALMYYNRSLSVFYRK